jgi:hypothetical protein
MNGDTWTQLFGIIKGALADRLLVWALLLSSAGLIYWVTMRNPEPIRLIGAGMLAALFVIVLYFSKKE